MTEPSISSLVTKLGKSTESLANKLTKQVKGFKVLLVWTSIGLLLDLTLSVLFVLLFHKSDTNSNRIDEVQQKTSTEVLCPLYDLFLDTWAPNSPAAKEDPAKYSDAFDKIEHGARVLNCPHSQRGAD